MYLWVHFSRIVLLITNDPFKVPKKNPFCVPNNLAYVAYLIWA